MKNLDKFCIYLLTKFVITDKINTVMTNNAHGKEVDVPLTKGQKLTNNPKDKLIQVRMDAAEVVKLDYLAEKQGSNRSEVIRRGIDIQYGENYDK